MTVLLSFAIFCVLLEDSYRKLYHFLSTVKITPKIEADQHKRITNYSFFLKVKFEVLDLDVDCTKEFVTLYNGNSQTQPHLAPPLCGNSLPTKMVTQGHQMLVEFHSAAGIPNPTNPRGGFKLTLSQDASGKFCFKNSVNFGQI